MSDKKLQDLKFAQARADGALKGHVRFMLNMHMFGGDTELMWERLREYHYEVERAATELADYLFSDAYALTDGD